MSKILILYTSHTQGHKVIAENIGFYLQQAGYEVRLEDILKVQSGALISFTRKLHWLINKYLPFIWRWLYLSPGFTNLTLPYRVKVASKNYQRTLEMINNYQPDVIITTQTTASAVVAYLKQKNLYNGKFGIAFSDFHLHRYWLYDEADFYLANIEEQKSEMVKLGIHPDKIFVCSMMLKPKGGVYVTAVKSKFNIKPEEKVVLFGGGSFGFGLNENLILQVSRQPGVKVIVITGKNEAEKKRLQRAFASANVVVLGFYQPFEELCAIADVFVTKPGGLSISEALRWQVPIMVLYMLPGQEELNFSYLKQKGLIMPQSFKPVDEITQELQAGNFKKVLINNPSLAELAPKPEVLLNALKTVINSE